MKIFLLGLLLAMAPLLLVNAAEEMLMPRPVLSPPPASAAEEQAELLEQQSAEKTEQQQQQQQQHNAGSADIKEEQIGSLEGTPSDLGLSAEAEAIRRVRARLNREELYAGEKQPDEQTAQREADAERATQGQQSFLSRLSMPSFSWPANLRARQDTGLHERLQEPLMDEGDSHGSEEAEQQQHNAGSADIKEEQIGSLEGTPSDLGLSAEDEAIRRVKALQNRKELFAGEEQPDEQTTQQQNQPALMTPPGPGQPNRRWTMSPRAKSMAKMGADGGLAAAGIYGLTGLSFNGTWNPAQWGKVCAVRERGEGAGC